MVIFFGVSDSLVNGAFGAIANGEQYRHWRQMIHSPNLMTLLPLFYYAVCNINGEHPLDTRTWHNRLVKIWSVEFHREICYYPYTSTHMAGMNGNWKSM